MMNNLRFKVGGALSDNDVDVYIIRQSDQEALDFLRGMSYLLLIEPRQQGKTSLLARLGRTVSAENSVFVYADVSGLRYSDKSLWVTDFWDRISSQLPDSFSIQPATPVCMQDLEKLLRQTAILAQEQSSNVIVALDELGSLANVPWTEEFFTKLRVFFNERAFMCTYWNHLTFIMTGTFHPRNLIKDENISPFNVAHRIHLKDFSQEQVGELVSKGPWALSQTSILTERIYFWTNGQPYLTQLLCSYLPITATRNDVDTAVERLRREDGNHLPPILERLFQDTELTKYLYKIQEGKRIKYYPRENKRHAQLELLGIIKQDLEGYCIIRNQIYNNALANLKPNTTSRNPLPKSPENEQGGSTGKKVNRRKLQKNISIKTTVRFEVQLSYLNDITYTVRVLQSPKGQSKGISQLPYSSEELITILKSLQAPQYSKQNYTVAQQNILQEHGLLANSHFAPDLQEQIGQALFHNLLDDQQAYASFEVAATQVRSDNSPLAFQLRFDEDATELARYPWELLHDGRRALLPSGMIELTRYISYPEATTPLSAPAPLRLLYISSRPNNLPELPPDTELEAIRESLQPLTKDGQLYIDNLTRATYNALLDYQDDYRPHILHFDGHGRFHRRCHVCHTFYYPHITQCKTCNVSLPEPKGYLAFEKEDGSVDWISSDILGHLFNSSLRLAVLSACHSGTVRGDSLFGGVGSALIQAGVPAVVATQLPISVDAARKFTKGFYRTLARYESLATAVNVGRRRLFNTKEWFIPVLYLRSQDDVGHLFTQPQEQ